MFRINTDQYMYNTYTSLNYGLDNFKSLHNSHNSTIAHSCIVYTFLHFHKDGNFVTIITIILTGNACTHYIGTIQGLYEINRE